MQSHGQGWGECQSQQLLKDCQTRITIKKNTHKKKHNTSQLKFQTIFSSISLHQILMGHNHTLKIIYCL